jgi:predicted tellurium resistance membrane protein TerC
VAAAAKGNYALLVFGLGVSVPAIVAGATVIMAMLNYFPLLLWAGAALLGWIAGDLFASDPVILDEADLLGQGGEEKIHLISSAVAALATVVAGLWFRRRMQANETA